MARATHPLRDFALALTTLTIMPVRARWPEAGHTDAPGYYPAVGALLGSYCVGFAAVGIYTGVSDRAPLVVAALLVATLAVATRAMHWDGLADVADALGVFDRTRRLEVMRDSSLGAFGVTAIVLCVVLQTASVATLLPKETAWTLFAAPTLARFAPTFAAWFGKPARADGLGASVMGRPQTAAIVPAVLTLALVGAVDVAFGGLPGGILTLFGVALALVVPHLIAARVGGVTGDVMGASVVLCETALLVGCAMVL